jgi:hypothetical protein
MKSFRDHHAGLQIIIDAESHYAQSVTIELQQVGCDECIKRAIIQLIVKDEKFRRLINECGRAANEIRSASKKPGTDSSLN